MAKTRLMFNFVQFLELGNRYSSFGSDYLGSSTSKGQEERRQEVEVLYYQKRVVL